MSPAAAPSPQPGLWTEEMGVPLGSAQKVRVLRSTMANCAGEYIIETDNYTLIAANDFPMAFFKQDSLEVLVALCTATCYQ